VLTTGHWPTGTGQVVVSRDPADTGSGASMIPGTMITLTGVPGSPKLTVVGMGVSVTNTADGWVGCGIDAVGWVAGRLERAARPCVRDAAQQRW
jgi:hypothetical protein